MFFTYYLKFYTMIKILFGKKSVNDPFKFIWSKGIGQQNSIWVILDFQCHVILVNYDMSRVTIYVKYNKKQEVHVKKRIKVICCIVVDQCHMIMTPQCHPNTTGVVVRIG